MEVTTLADEVKFSEEELTKVPRDSRSYTNLQNELGRIGGSQEIIMAQRVESITDRKAEIEKEWKANQLKEQDLVKTLSDNMAKVHLTLQTGTFVPKFFS